MKPRLRRWVLMGRYVWNCEGGDWAANGDSPQHAYELWLSAFDGHAFEVHA